MKVLFLLIILGVFVAPIFPQNNIKPFVLKLNERPSVLKIGQTHKFVFTVQNNTQTPLTLSSVCAAQGYLLWKKGSTQGLYPPSCDRIRIIHGTDRDKYFTVTIPAGASKDDFFTLAANESKSFDVELEVPKGIKAKFVNVRLRFESRYDGKAAGLEAWLGTPSYIDLKMRLEK